MGCSRSHYEELKSNRSIVKQSSARELLRPHSSKLVGTNRAHHRLCVLVATPLTPFRQYHWAWNLVMRESILENSSYWHLRIGAAVGPVQTLHRRLSPILLLREIQHAKASAESVVNSVAHPETSRASTRRVHWEALSSA
ncbi:unnamed protein product, partial [Hydatigera taeniaeformis]|uniref:Uncharacterized protein n=1 Tax=Hydatigena taeniaeformis TaxID=6205 RepID=A0A0R3WYV3_HYDTA